MIRESPKYRASSSKRKAASECNVYILGDKTPIGHITLSSESDWAPDTVIVNDDLSEIAQKINKEILQQIGHQKKRQHLSPDSMQIHTIQGTDVSFMMIDVWKWRHCTGYVILQKSDLATRLLVYYDDMIMHSAAGTSCDVADMKRKAEESLKAWKSKS